MHKHVEIQGADWHNYKCIYIIVQGSINSYNTLIHVNVLRINRGSVMTAWFHFNMYSMYLNIRKYYFYTSVTSPLYRLPLCTYHLVKNPASNQTCIYHSNKNFKKRSRILVLLFSLTDTNVELPFLHTVD